MSSVLFPDHPADLAIATGEASGDWIGELAISQLKSDYAARGQQLLIEGIAGPKLRQAGVLALHQSEELSVRGYVEVLRHLPRLLQMRKRLIQRWSKDAKPKVFVGVDAPDFNMAIELAVKQAGVPSVHMVCPSIWAWRMERIKKIKAACDHVLCLFPFEPAILASEQIPSTYMGHPMAHLIPKSVDASTYRKGLSLHQDSQLLAVLPGSRKAEVTHLAPLFIETCRKLKQAKPQLKFVTPLPAGSLHSLFLDLLPNSLKEDWTVVEGQSHEAMGAADAVLLASGTATLEAMMFKKPMVISYKMPWLSYQLMKGKGYLPYVGLPNILLKEFAVPELIQNDATVDKLYDAVLFQLDNDANREKLLRQFSEQHELLTQPSGQICAEVVGQYL